MDAERQGSDQVRRLVERLAPDPICDDCIAEKLALSDPRDAEQTSRELAGRDGFERGKDPCAICGAEKLVIRKRARSI